MRRSLDDVVLGGGLSGCAAAAAAAPAGAGVELIEGTRHLGGAAARAEHRTLCGFAPLDAATAEILEPGLAKPWVDAIATGDPYRHGRVWLWPTDSAQVMQGCAGMLRAAGVTARLGVTATSLVREADGFVVETSDGPLRARRLIDASGRSLSTTLGDAPWTPACQWPAHRSVLCAEIARGPGARLRAIDSMARAIGSSAAIALTPIGIDEWQLSIDVPPGTAVADAARSADKAAAAVSGRLTACARVLGMRDEGRAAGSLSCEELFAERARGLCWASWPCEQHLASGIVWRWPARDRYGVPERSVRIPGAGPAVWAIGKAMPVSAEAAAALRVTGTCVALGASVGRQAAASLAHAAGAAG
jgi:hypothetical protein